MSKAGVADGRGSASALEQTADALRRLAMSKPAGEFLGAEDQLVRLLGASRPTFRQAAAQLMQENLIEVRRGVGGGYFARLPDTGVVSRIAAIYLRSHQVPLEEIVQAIEPTKVEIAKLAAHSANDEARARLGEFLLLDEAQESDDGYRRFLKSEREFGRILGEMSGSRALDLFLEILYDFTSLLSRGEGVFTDRPARVISYRALRREMARAIFKRDAEIAVIAARRCASQVNEWLREDHAQPSLRDFAANDGRNRGDIGT